MEEAVTPFPRPLTTPPETTTYFMTRDSRCDARASVAAARPRGLDRGRGRPVRRAYLGRVVRSTRVC